MAALETCFLQVLNSRGPDRCGNGGAQSTPFICFLFSLSQCLKFKRDPVSHLQTNFVFKAFHGVTGSCKHDVRGLKTLLESPRPERLCGRPSKPVHSVSISHPSVLPGLRQHANGTSQRARARTTRRFPEPGPWSGSPCPHRPRWRVSRHQVGEPCLRSVLFPPPPVHATHHFWSRHR